MKLVHGVWLPDLDTHCEEYLAMGPFIDGRGTYQRRKYVAGMQHFKGCRTALDIGGHVGFWSLSMARDFERVVAFEPLTPHVECFRANCGELDNVEIIQTALGDGSGKVRVKFHADNTGASHVADEGEKVDLVSLDSFGFQDVDFIKIDVEGFENEVLHGGEQTIRSNRPAIIIEQKPGYVGRFGQHQFQARDLLVSWGMKQVWNLGDDVLLTF